MRLVLALLFSLPVLASAQWRPVKVSSGTDVSAIQENFRRASLFSNRKLDKFSNETMYGSLTVGSFTVTNVTVTGTGSFSGTASTTTFSGWVDIGREITTNSCNSATECTVTCSAGKVVSGGGCSGGGVNNGIIATYPSAANQWKCYTESSANIVSYALCVRVK